MKNNLLFLALVLLANTLLAQPTLQNNVFPKLGDVVTQAEGDTYGIEPGPGGANQVWDFTGLIPLTFQPQIQLTVVEADNTPYISQFPEANLSAEVVTPDGNLYQYMKVEGDKISTLGSAATGVFFEFSDPQVNLVTPLEYHQGFNDAYQSAVVIPGVGEFHNRSVKASEYDAYGMLKMPDATFNNAIRLKTVEVSIDSIASDQGYTITFLNITSYEWYVPNRPGPQVSVSYSGGYTKTVVPGFPELVDSIQVSKSVNFVSELITSGIQSPDQLDLAIEAFGPNPTAGDITLRFSDQELTGELQVMVLNSQGQLLQSRIIRPGEGDNVLTIAAQDLPAGQYFLSLSNGRAVKTLPWMKS